VCRDRVFVRADRSGRDGLWSLLLAAGLAVLVLGPVLLRRGYVLRGDMVFVPHMPWKGGWLGLDGAVPRSVPGDAVVWVLGQVLPGDLVQKVVLLAALTLAGVGIAALVSATSLLSRAAAITTYLWNPWVAERLAIGQWPCLVGYACLPWLVLTSARWREREPGGWAGTAALLAASAICAPSVGLLAVGLSGAVLLARPRLRSLAGLVVTALVVNAPWIVPALGTGGSLTGSDAQFAAFAARGESGAGVVASTTSLGGIWKASVVPGERTSSLIVLASVLLAAVAVVGWLRGRALDRRTRNSVFVAGVASVLLVSLSAWPVYSRLLGDASGALPALGLLRDANRYLAPWSLVLAVGLAQAVGWLQKRALPGREGLRALALVLVGLPLLLLPSLAWGLGGDLAPVSYPPEWQHVRRELASAGAGNGRVVVLPWQGSYRGFAWNGRHAGLDPAPRFFPGDVLVDDRLYLTDRVIASEDRYLRGVGAALSAPDSAGRLRHLGVRWVVVEKGQGTTLGRAAPQGRIVHEGTDLTVIDLGPAGRYQGSQLPTWTIVGADLGAGLVLVSTVFVLARRRRVAFASDRVPGGGTPGGLSR
jgi:hypothetical protein